MEQYTSDPCYVVEIVPDFMGRTTPGGNMQVVWASSPNDVEAMVVNASLPTFTLTVYMGQFVSTVQFGFQVRAIWNRGSWQMPVVEPVPGNRRQVNRLAVL